MGLVNFRCSFWGQETMRRATGPWSDSPPCSKFHTQAWDFPGCHAALLNTEGLMQFADAPEMFTPSLPVQSQSDNERRLKLAGEIRPARRGQRRRNAMFHKVTLKKHSNPRNEEDLWQVWRINISVIILEVWNQGNTVKQSLQRRASRVPTWLCSSACFTGTYSCSQLGVL